MTLIRRIANFVAGALRWLKHELRTAIPGGPGGRVNPWEEADDIEHRRRRQREVWRKGVDEE